MSNREKLIELCAQAFMDSADPDGGWEVCLEEANDFVDYCTDFEINEHIRAVEECDCEISFNPMLFAFTIVGK